MITDTHFLPEKLFSVRPPPDSVHVRAPAINIVAEHAPFPNEYAAAIFPQIDVAGDDVGVLPDVHAAVEAGVHAVAYAGDMYSPLLR